MKTNVVGIKFFTGGISISEYIACKFDRHDLRAETDSEVWYLLFSCVASRGDHPLCSTSSESSSDTDSVESIEEFCSLYLYLFCFDEFQLDLLLMGVSCTLESLIQ